MRSALVAMAIALVCIGIPYAVPGLERLQLLSPLSPGAGISLAPAPVETVNVGERQLPPMKAERVELLRVPQDVAIPKGAEVVEDEPPVSISGAPKALNRFFEKLVLVENGADKLARVAAWGDSNVASDLVTSVFRRALQKRFGDGGHGFVLLTRTSKNYYHNDVRQIAASGWGVSAMTTPLAQDGLYGLGATTFRSIGKGAFAKIATADEGDFGRTCSRVVIDYLEQPAGGGFEVRVDGAVRQTIATDAPSKRAKLATLVMSEGPHEIEIRSTSGDARIFGLWLERSGPGVVVDALGVTNSKMRYLLRTDEAFLAEQIELRGSDLLLFNFGVNGAREGATLWGGEERYARDMRDVLGRMRRHHPNRSCLVVSPGDAAAAFGKTRVSFPLVAQIVAIQGRVATEAGCAFWNMHAAMGGEGSMDRWERRGLGKKDLLHPTNAGATLLGRWLYLALMERFRVFKTESR